MKVFNLIWGFSLGAGIDKCFLTYDSLSQFDPSVEIHSVCIDLSFIKSDLGILNKRGVKLIKVKSRTDFSWVGKLYTEIIKVQPDLVFTHGFNGAIMMLIQLIFKGVKVPLVCSEHGLYFGRTRLKKLFLEPIYNGLMFYTYKHYAKRIICVDQASRKYWIDKGVDSSKIVTVHNGIEENPIYDKIKLSDYGLSNSKMTLMTASALYEIKGLTYLLDALSIVKSKTDIPFQYAILGAGPDLDMLTNQAARLNIQENVFFMGYQENVTAWLDVSDIFLLPSLSECHSIAMLEAMRAGKGIIATNVGGNSESIRNKVDGLLVPPKKSEDLANAILQMLNDENMRLSLAKSSNERFKKMFTETSMFKNLITALNLEK
jgi:glycosyltransferase involved in cell wall biosynthesis